MGKIAASYDIKLESVDVDVGKIKENIEKILKDKCEVKSMEEIPLAFGLKSIKLLILFDDKSGKSIDVESLISTIDGVGSIESSSTTLL